MSAQLDPDKAEQVADIRARLAELRLALSSMPDAEPEPAKRPDPPSPHGTLPKGFAKPQPAPDTRPDPESEPEIEPEPARDPAPDPAPEKEPEPASPRGTLPKGFARPVQAPARPADSAQPGPAPDAPAPPDSDRAGQIDAARARLAELRRALASLPDDDSPPDAAAPAAPIAAYCIKCRKKTAMSGPAESRLKNGRPAVRGTCSECGSAVVRMGSLSPRRG